MKTKIFLLLFFCSLSFVSLSVDYYWVNGSGNWSEQSHWSLSSGGPPATSLPGNADNVIIDVDSGITGTPFTITINGAISVFNITIENEFASITVNGYPINCNDFVVVKANELEAVNSSFTLTGEKWDIQSISSVSFSNSPILTTVLSPFSFNGNDEIYNDLTSSSEQLTINGSNTFGLLKMSSIGADVYLENGKTLTIDSLAIQADCDYHSLLTTINPVGIVASVQKTGHYQLTVEFLDVTNVTAISTGGYTYYSLNGVMNDAIGWETKGRKLYWIGDGGNWTDLNHWSLTSGGTPDALCLPNYGDSVIFDNNSFFIDNEVVFVDEEAFVSYMDWNDISFDATLELDTTLHINGDIVLSQNLIISPIEVVDVIEITGSSNVDAQGAAINCNIFINTFDSDDIVKLESDLVQGDSLGIFLNSGQFNLNNFDLFADFIMVSPDLKAKRLDFTNSNITLSGEFNAEHAINFTFDAGTSSLFIGDTIYDIAPKSNYLLTTDLLFNRVTLDFRNNGEKQRISGNNIFNELTILKGSDITIDSTKTQLILGKLEILGNCEDSVFISSSNPAIPAVFDFNSAADTDVFAVHLTSVNATGINPPLLHSSSSGIETGWDFSPTPTIHSLFTLSDDDCYGDTVYINNLSSVHTGVYDDMTFRWYFNDGSTGYYEYHSPTDSTWIEYEADTNRHVFEEKGYFNVTLEVVNNINYCKSEHVEMFYVKNPSAFLSSTSLTHEICQGELVGFDVSSDTSAAVFQFYLNDNPVGGVSPNGTFETTNINHEDVISVRAFLDNCPSTSAPEIEFIVNDLPTFDWNVTSVNATICEEESFAFEAEIVGSGTNYVFQYLKNESPVKVGADYFTNQIDNEDVIYLVARNEKNCRDTISQIFTVLPLPPTSLSSSVTENTICEGDEVIFTASGAEEYEFFVNGVSQFGPSTGNVFPTSALDYGDLVTVIGISNAGCSAIALETFSYYVNSLPTVNLLTDQPTTICKGTTVDFSANGAAQYEFFINGATVQGLSSTNTFSSNSLTDQDEIQVVGTFSGCSNLSTPITFTVLDAPTTSLVSDAPGNVTCRNTPVTFTASGAAQYEFFLNEVSLGGASSNTTYTTNSLLNGQTITVKGVNGTCELSKSITMEILPIPSVNIFSSVTNNTICEGESITFTGTNSAQYEFFVDDISQGVPQASPSFTPLFNQSGSYEVHIVGTGANNCLSGSNDTIVVDVNPIPMIDVISSVPGNEICQGESVVLDASGADKYQLFVDNVAQGGYTTSNIFTLTSLQNGETVSIVGNSLGCTSSPYDHNFVVNPKPALGLTSSVTNHTFCESSVETYQATGANQYQFFVNNVSQGSFSSNDILTTSGFTTGTYPIKVIGELNNCLDSTEVQVTVNPLPTIDLSVSNTIICEGENVTYYAEGGSLYEFFRNGASQGTPTTFNSFTSSSLQNGDVISVQVTSSFGCAKLDVAAPITVNQIPNVGLVNTGSDTICTGNQVDLIGSGAADYEFFVNGVSQGQTTNPVFNSTILNDGDVITVTGHQNGCSNTSSNITINVNPFPIVSLINNNITSDLCANEATDLTALGASEYQFSINGVAVGNYSSNPYFNSTLNDNDVVSVNGKLNDCISSANQTISFTVYETPLLNVTTSAPSAVVCKDEQVTFTTTGAMTYAYYLNDNLMQVGANPDFEFSSLEDGDEVKIIGYNGHCLSSPELYDFTVNSMSLQMDVSPSNMICKDTPVSFTANGADVYQFFVNGVAQGTYSNNNSFDLNNGVDLDEVTFVGKSNSTQCEQEYGDVITVNVISEPTITASSSYEFCERDSVILYSNSQYGNQWYHNGNPISGATDSTYIAFLEGSYSLEVTQGGDGDIWTRGDNGSGIYGDSTNLNKLNPVKALSDKTFKQVVGGSFHVIALTNNGEVYAWGKNNNGQLGDGTYSNKNYPKQIVSLTNIKSVAVSDESNAVVTTAGEMYVWGRNDYGQLGTGSNMVVNFPYLNSNVTDVDTVAGGEHHFVILKNDGTVWTMGANTSGQLGNGSIVASFLPVHIPTLTNIVSVGVGKSNSFAIDSDGNLYVWGANESGQLGLGDITNRTVPVLNSFKKIRQAVGGSKHSIFLSEGNHVYTSGDNSFGQLGTGNFISYLSPIKIDIGGVASISAGKNTSLLLKNDHNVFGFGNNEYKQLSENNIVAIHTAQHISKVEGVTYINASENSNHFIFGVNASCVSPSFVDVTVHPVQDVSIVIEDNELSINTSSLAVSYQWFLNGLPIPGATNSTYIAPTGGEYSVEVTFEGGCSVMSSAVSLEILSIDNMNLIDAIQGYPNPTSNNFTIAFGGAWNGQEVVLSIFDKLGRKMEEIKILVTDVVHVPFSEYDAGSYQVVVRNEETAFMKTLHVIKIN